MWFKKQTTNSSRADELVPAPVNAPASAPVRVEHRADGKLFAVAGASRSGKSVWTMQQVRRARRLLVWDYPKREWAQRNGCRGVVDDGHALYELTRPGSKPARVAFTTTAEDPAAAFALWCRIAFGYAHAHGAPIVAEELSSVTHPGKAPAAWGNLCRMALGFGSDIYALTQRPAESDKTALGNATIVHCGRMVIPADSVTMAAYLGVPAHDIRALQPLEYIQRDAMGTIRRGRVTPNR